MARRASTASIVTGGRRISGEWTKPSGDTRAACLLAHGAGARRDHPSMEGLAEVLAAHGFLTFRFNFPYAESGRKVPDRADVLVRTWVDVWNWAASADEIRGVPVFAGGRSMGGRMASMAAARHPDVFTPGGLVFFAYPLHSPGRTNVLRAEHLSSIRQPMLFLSGTRDSMARVDLLNGVVKKLGKRAMVHWIEEADHGFHVRKRSGRTDDDVREEAVEVVMRWYDRKVGAS